MYAVALYETARERGVIGDVQQGLEAIYEAYSDKTFRNFFTSPRVPRRRSSIACSMPRAIC